jgi:hypothetical protein
LVLRASEEIRNGAEVTATKTIAAN